MVAVRVTSLHKYGVLGIRPNDADQRIDFFCDTNLSNSMNMFSCTRVKAGKGNAVVLITHSIDR